MSDEVVLSLVQDLLIVLGLAVAAGGLYTLLVGGVAVAVPGGLRRGLTVMLSLLISVMALGVALTLFQGMASLLRREASEDFGVFIFWAGVAFFALYGALLVLSAVTGYILGSRRMSEGLVTGAVTALALALFMSLTFPMVEFVNSCFVGRAFILSAMC